MFSLACKGTVRCVSVLVCPVDLLVVYFFNVKDPDNPMDSNKQSLRHSSQQSHGRPEAQKEVPK